MLWDAAHDYRRLRRSPAAKTRRQRGRVQPGREARSPPPAPTARWCSGMPLTTTASSERSTVGQAAVTTGSRSARTGTRSPPPATRARWCSGTPPTTTPSSPSARGGQDTVNGVAFSPDGNTLAAAGGAGQGGALGRRSRLPQSSPRSTAAKARSSWRSRSARTARRSPPAAATARWCSGTPLTTTAGSRRSPAAKSTVNGVAFSPDGNTLAAAGDDGKVVLWDAAHDYRRLPALGSGQGTVYGVAFSPDGNTLAAAGGDGKVVLWDAAHDYRRLAGARQRPRRRQRGRVQPGREHARRRRRRTGRWCSGTSSHDYRKLAGPRQRPDSRQRGRVQPGRKDARRRRLRRQGGALGRRSRLHASSRPSTAAKTPSTGSRSARTATRSPPPARTARWCSGMSPTSTAGDVLASSNSYVYGVAFSPDGKTLAAAGDDGDVVLWDAAHDYTKLPPLVRPRHGRPRGRVQPGRKHPRRCRLRQQGAALGHLLDQLRRPEGQGVRPRPRQPHRGRMGDGRARTPLQHDLPRLTGRRCYVLSVLSRGSCRTSRSRRSRRPASVSPVVTTGYSKNTSR